MSTQTKTAHTPGPWKVAHSGYANTPFVLFAGTVKPNFAKQFPLSGVNAIAEIFHDESEQHEEQAANARVMGAAPDMLEALEALLDIAPLAEDLATKLIHDCAHAAIQKARTGK